MYVGNLSFFTTEEQLYELFGRAGDIKRIVMGLDKFKKTPCGFCFVEYFTRYAVHVADNLALFFVFTDTGFIPFELCTVYYSFLFLKFMQNNC